MEEENVLRHLLWWTILDSEQRTPNCTFKAMTTRKGEKFFLRFRFYPLDRIFQFSDIFNFFMQILSKTSAKSFLNQIAEE